MMLAHTRVGTSPAFHDSLTLRCSVLAQAVKGEALPSLDCSASSLPSQFLIILVFLALYLICNRL
jgi:hypothetical protein